MNDLRAELQELLSKHGFDASETRRVRARMNSLLARLPHLRLHAKRTAYFQLDVHFAAFHKKSIESPFPCPECRLNGRDAPVIDGMLEWSIHTETVHGKLHSPKPGAPDRLRDRGPRTYERPPKAPCLLCWTMCCIGQGYSRHFNKAHRSNDVKESFPFPACQRLGLGQNVLIDGIQAWIEHSRDAHGVDGQRGIPTSEPERPKVIVQRGRAGKISKRIAANSGGMRLPYCKRTFAPLSRETTPSVGKDEVAGSVKGNVVEVQLSQPDLDSRQEEEEEEGMEWEPIAADLNLHEASQGLVLDFDTPSEFVNWEE